MRTSLTRTYKPHDLIPYAWVINYWLIYANTHVLSLITTTDVGVLKPNTAITSLGTNEAIEATDKYLPKRAGLANMDSYEPEALMRFTASVSLNIL